LRSTTTRLPFKGINSLITTVEAREQC
jgi:hypothetical protein